MAHWAHYHPGYDQRTGQAQVAHPTVSYQHNPYNAPPSNTMPFPHAVGLQTISQTGGGLNMGHLRILADHFDRAFAASQQVLLERISKQDALLAQQQESLSSISELLCNGRSESIKQNETLRVKVYDIGKKMDRITKGISESMKLLAAGTIKAITECQTTIEKGLLCVEETCEGIKEEIRDPQANIDATVYHEIAIGSESPIRTASYCGAATAPPSPPAPSFETPPQSSPCSVRGRSVHSEQHPDNYVSPCRDSVLSYSELHANGVDISESPSSTGQLPYDTVNPMDTLRAPTPSNVRSSSLDLYFAGQIDTEQYEESPFAAMPKCPAESASDTLNHTLHLDSARDNQPPAGPLTPHCPSSPLETISSSQRVLNMLQPVTEGLRGTEQVSACSSPAPLSSALASARTSTVSLPEPSVLLNEYLGMPKNKESQVTSFTIPTSHAHLLSRVESLSSLSSLSDDLPPLVPSAPAPSSRSRKAANVRSSTSPKKRRRSSPGSKRGKAAKKPRIKAQSGMTKPMKKELLDRSDVLKAKIPGKKASTTSALGSSSLPSQPLDNVMSRQFIQCDKCELWYHWGCVGIRDNDPRLRDDVDFACPLCQDSKTLGPRPSPPKEGQGEVCSWPDCEFEDDPVEEFFVEKIIGRYDRKLGGIERFSWLVKWEGYPAEESTWTPEAELTKPEKLIEEFKSAAKAEGILPSNSTLNLLQEAVDAGWDNSEV